MNEKDLLSDLQQLDNLLARCVNPPLTRTDHDNIRNLMSVIVKRIKLSYKLEAEKKEAQEADKEDVKPDKSET